MGASTQMHHRLLSFIAAAMNDHPPESADNLDLTGQTVGEYYLIRRLGRGGMADVYLAEQRSLKRNVALKILKPELARDNSYVRRFQLEAQAAAALVQANIVQIYEVNESGGLHFISQEYVPGRNLRQYIERYGAVEPVMAINVLRQVALALQKAGEMNVIHRDIKPENIMLSTKGEVKVADFGLARINNEKARQDLTQIGITMGTPLYMSPEQVAGKHVDSRSDIYSLGVTAYHMLAGRPPYEGDNALAIALQHVNQQSEPLVELRPDVPPALCELIHTMMSKLPEDRPADATALLKELRKVKIDIDEDWDQLIEKLATSESASHESARSTLESKLAVTQQLEAVMKGNIRSWWTSPATIALFSVLLLAGLTAGFWNAVTHPPKDLLDVTEAILNVVPRQADVKAQYRCAFLEDVNGEEYWQAVIKYFPLEAADDQNNTLYYHRRAEQRLGELYIERNEWDRALAIYQKLGDINDDEEFHIIGSAGQAIVYDQQLKEAVNNDQLTKALDKKVRRALSEVENDIEKLNPFMRSRIENLLGKYASKSSYANDPRSILT